MGCSLPRLTHCRRQTGLSHPCGWPHRAAVPDGRGFHVGSRGLCRFDRRPGCSAPA